MYCWHLFDQNELSFDPVHASDSTAHGRNSFPSAPSQPKLDRSHMARRGKVKRAERIKNNLISSLR